MTCTCECHKLSNISELKKCRDKGKSKDKKIKELEKKLLTVTVIVAIMGTIVGKEVVENVLEYFETFDKIKTSITYDIPSKEPKIFPEGEYYGTSPAAGTLAIFGLLALAPTKRRR